MIPVTKLVFSVLGKWMLFFRLIFYLASEQCDQMARLFVQYLTNENIEKLPNWKYISQILLITEWTLKRLPKKFQILPKWWNFAKSGHTGIEWAPYRITTQGIRGQIFETKIPC